MLAQDEGLLIVNGGVAERSAELLTAIGREFPGRQPRVLFKPTGTPTTPASTPRWVPSAARIVAHENTKGWLSIEVVGRWQKRTFVPCRRRRGRARRSTPPAR